LLSFSFVTTRSVGVAWNAHVLKFPREWDQDERVPPAQHRWWGSPIWPAEESADQPETVKRDVLSPEMVMIIAVAHAGPFH
jgi:hypothetical protein